MKVAIVGSRSFEDYSLLKRTMNEIHAKTPISLVVSGGAGGADSLGERWAGEQKIPVKIYYPDWETHGRAAGPIRNQDIVKSSELIVAFWDGQSRGTKSTINLARKAGKEIQIISV